MTTYTRNGYTDSHRSSKTWDAPQPQDAPISGRDLIDALKLQTPDVQDAVLTWAAAQETAPSHSTLYARIGRERKNHPVSLGALHTA